MSGNNSIEVNNVTYIADGKTIIKDITFGLNPGELIGVIGPNGAGKSTLIKNMVRIVEPDSGDVTLMGEPVSHYDAQAFARSVAYVPQSTEFTFPITVEEAVLMGRIPHLSGVRMEGAHDYTVSEQCLKVVGMEDFAERLVTSLSGGERQLVAIGRALVQEPAFLLMDEPTSNLDIHHQLTIMGLLVELTRSGKGILVVLHDLTLASRFCTKILAMSGGRVVSFGTPAEVLTEETISRTFRVSIRIERNEQTGSTIIEPLEPL
ncbi:MAG: ABC transporter ATP-binding protein [Candidatus Dadabacteria bacterium]|nr:ABC transporter ATP-binding protein [Candidatus Dadabacteria bacterium]